MNILVTVSMDPMSLDLLRGLTEANVDLLVDISRKKLYEQIENVHVLVAGTSTPIDREVLEKASQLRLIGLMGKGRPLLDIESATHRGVLVIDAPGSVAVSIAEHVLTLIFALARRIPEADNSVKKGVWLEKSLMGREIRNKVLGIIGYGRIGSLVAERARGMKMHVIVYDPHLSSDAVKQKGCRMVTREELFSTSDIISIHAPLNPETMGLIGVETIPLLKPGVMVVNCSASRIIDEGALYDAILSGNVAGLAIDLHDEMPLEEHPLYLSEKVICTPNLSTYTHEAMVEGSKEIAGEIVNYLQKGTITHALNLPEVEESISELGQAWMELGEVMGRFIIQLHPFGLKRVRIDVDGEEGTPSMEVFSRSVLKGLLGQILGETVNLVNARSLASQRGIQLTERRQNASENYLTQATVTVETEQGEGIVSGTLFDGHYPRIVQVDEFELEAVPDGDFLVVFNRDRPGVIGNIGETLGRHSVNIGQMYNGRDTPGGKAITLLRIDSPISGAVLQEVRGLPNILNTTMVKLVSKEEEIER